MKTSSERLESPPPKPPRRISSNKMHREETVKNESKLQKQSPEPVYLSLPANFTECNVMPVPFSQSFSLYDQLKQSEKSDFCEKRVTGDVKIAESDIKQVFLRNAEKFQEIDYDALFQSENAVACFRDKFYQNSIGNTREFITNTYTGKSFLSFHKDCHRRHNSDPVVSHFDLQNRNFDQEKCCYNNCTSHKKVNRPCESCTCCRKSYFHTHEIRILKETNEKLWHHLCSLLNYVENMQKKTCSDSPDISFSDLLSSVYYAQKARDCAMEERLKILLEERDSVIREYEELFEVMSKSFDCLKETNSEKDIQTLVSEIESTYNPSMLLQNQKMLLTQISKRKELNQDSFSQQLKKAEMERDCALDKVRKLEEEIKDLKLSYDIWHSDNKQWEFNIFDILNQVMHQRDTILSKIDNSTDLSNIICWPPKSSKLESLEEHHQNASQCESQTKLIEPIKSHYLSDYKSTFSFGTSDEVTKLKEEILFLNKALKSEMEKKELAEEQCVKLERLTLILRKKLNGQNVGVFV